MALLRKEWSCWLAPVSIVKIQIKFDWEKYYRELSYLGSPMFRGPVWAQDEKTFISREASPIFPNLNCVFMYKKAKFPPKFQNFPPHINISQEWASQIPDFFSPWVWARSTVQKWVLPTLGDLPAELGYFKIVCRGLKLLGERPNIGLLWSRLPRAKMPIFRGSLLKFWQHWHKSWSNHYWQHGFWIRDVITDLFTNRPFFYHLNSTSSWQPKVRTFNTPQRFSSAYFDLKAMHQ